MISPQNRISQQPCYPLLNAQIRAFLDAQAAALRLSVQDCRLSCEIALDLQMWGNQSIEDIWPDATNSGAAGKALKQQIMKQLRLSWEGLKSELNSYPADTSAAKVSLASKPLTIEKDKIGMGRCPVASPRTLCCNLQTLDAVDNCGYGCSYCSIQSFFDGKQISFDQDFTKKLSKLTLDPEQIYHIGTGQSSDSLMWGNSHGVQDALIDFARANPNVILELKTKSANVSHLLRSQAPRNIICTWSLNTPILIRHEEHGTASLDKRLDAARRVADAGHIIGFHFHPIIHYDNWREDYSAVVEELTARFSVDEVALVSMGTLTYIKSVMREIRRKAIPSQILKMPMVNADGKLSYPDEIKLSMFRHVYDSFSDIWKESVFYYICMENQRFWKPVFGFDYASNDEFESTMKNSYLAKIAASALR
ncbi:MAG: DNA photolyase [Gammaproteobacteria bacterium]|nr:DNA photolyase [Gammaproteobacteria bacterium]